MLSTLLLAAALGAPTPARLTIACDAPGTPISEGIYGIAWDAQREGEPGEWELRPSTRRWGGNASSRYNWKLDTRNNAADWFFKNERPGRGQGRAWERFLSENARHGVTSTVSLPMLGWVARDDRSRSFPRGGVKQTAYAPEDPQAGNGVGESGPLAPGPPTTTSVAAPPEFIAEWVAAIRRKSPGAERRYVLDNEPMLWSETHRDVRTTPLSYDELLERTVAYGTAVRRADPSARIAGPAAWGWLALHYSGVDAAAGFEESPDRRAHGGRPLLPWYLEQLREHRRRTGVRILDDVDVHFYPEGEGIGMEGSGETDRDTALRRIRSVRALWDPGYRDESWIDEPIQLIPRLRRWIEETDPGLGVVIGEYSFGAEQHISGGLALAEALGRFGLERVTAAYYWTWPPQGSPAYWAFRAYRDFDGRGGRFLPRSVPARADDGLSLFASRDEAGGRIVAVALNLDPDGSRDASLTLGGCRPVRWSAWTYRQGSRGLVRTGGGAHQIRHVLPAWSITVFDVQVAGRGTDGDGKREEPAGRDGAAPDERARGPVR